jgi:quinol monooxygenase YgiN
LRTAFARARVALDGSSALRMYAVTISIRATDAEAAVLLHQASREVVAPSLAEPGCLYFDTLFDDSDPLLVRFYEAYTDRSAFEAHLEMAHTRRWQEICLPLIDRSSIRMPESVSAWRAAE